MKNLLKLTVIALSIFASAQVEACSDGYHMLRNGACVRNGGLLGATGAPGSQKDPSGHGCSLDGGYMWCPGSNSCARTCPTGFWTNYNS
jgi:hypothetical protein